jgi:hypothetical protein
MLFKNQVNSDHASVTCIRKLVGTLILTLTCLSATAAKEEFYAFTGYELSTVLSGSTVEAATLSFDIDFSDELSVDLLYLFEGDPVTTVISSSFNEVPLEIIIGDTPIPGELNYLIIDVEDFADQSGTFELSLSSTGSEVSTLFLVTNMPVDADEDGLADEDETDTGIFVDDSDTGTDPENIDTDGDGMGDGFELFYGLSPLDSSDGAMDLDQDGLTNLVEFLDGTSPGPARSLAGDAVEANDSVPPPQDPIPEAARVTTLGGQTRDANFGMGAYSDKGTPTFGNNFISGDFVTIIGEVTPDPIDVGINGELFVAFLSVIGGKATFSYINEDGNFASWDTSLGGLGPVEITTPLEANHQITIFEGNLQAGTHKFTLAYKAEGGPLVYMKPITIKVTD